MTVKIVLLAAIAPDGTIGHSGRCEVCGGSGYAADSLGSLCGNCLGGYVDPPDRLTHPDHDAFILERTRDAVLLMGRRTWEMYGDAPLTNRTNIVLTSRREEDRWSQRFLDIFRHLAALGHSVDGCAVSSVEEALKMAEIFSETRIEETRAAHLIHLDRKLSPSDIERMSTLYVLGGAQLFSAMLPLADALLITLIATQDYGDVGFRGSDILAMSDSLGAAHIDAGHDPSPWWFECVERRPGSDPIITFTKWVRDAPR